MTTVLTYRGFTELLWSERIVDGFAGICRIEVPLRGAPPADPAALLAYVEACWIGPGKVSDRLDITSVELELLDRGDAPALVFTLETDPPIDDRAFVGHRMAADIRAALRHARRAHA